MKFASFLTDEAGSVSVEYALIAVIISIGIVVTLDDISVLLQGYYAEIAGSF